MQGLINFILISSIVCWFVVFACYTLVLKKKETLFLISWLVIIIVAYKVSWQSLELLAVKMFVNIAYLIKVVLDIQKDENKKAALVEKHSPERFIERCQACHCIGTFLSAEKLTILGKVVHNRMKYCSTCQTTFVYVNDESSWVAISDENWKDLEERLDIN